MGTRFRIQSLPWARPGALALGARAVCASLNSPDGPASVSIPRRPNRVLSCRGRLVVRVCQRSPSRRLRCTFVRRDVQCLPNRGRSCRLVAGRRCVFLCHCLRADLSPTLHVVLLLLPLLQLLSLLSLLQLLHPSSGNTNLRLGVVWSLAAGNPTWCLSCHSKCSARLRLVRSWYSSRRVLPSSVSPMAVMSRARHC